MHFNTDGMDFGYFRFLIGDIPVVAHFHGNAKFELEAQSFVRQKCLFYFSGLP